MCIFICGVYFYSWCVGVVFVWCIVVVIGQGLAVFVDWMGSMKFVLSDDDVEMFTELSGAVLPGCTISKVMDARLHITYYGVLVARVGVIPVRGKRRCERCYFVTSSDDRDAPKVGDVGSIVDALEHILLLHKNSLLVTVSLLIDNDYADYAYSDFEGTNRLDISCYGYEVFEVEQKIADDGGYMVTTIKDDCLTIFVTVKEDKCVEYVTALLDDLDEELSWDEFRLL